MIIFECSDGGNLKLETRCLEDSVLFAYLQKYDMDLFTL